VLQSTEIDGLDRTVTSRAGDSRGLNGPRLLFSREDLRFP
jgi:hypothetical protein